MKTKTVTRKWAVVAATAVAALVTVAPMGGGVTNAAPQKAEVVKSLTCRASKSGRVNCKYVNPGPRFWNNGKAHGYFWPKS